MSCRTDASGPPLCPPAREQRRSRLHRPVRSAGGPGRERRRRPLHGPTAAGYLHARRSTGRRIIPRATSADSCRERASQAYRALRHRYPLTRSSLSTHRVGRPLSPADPCGPGPLTTARTSKNAWQRAHFTRSWAPDEVSAAGRWQKGHRTGMSLPIARSPFIRPPPRSGACYTAQTKKG